MPGPEFGERFRSLALARCDEICEVIVDKATDGERWAAELVIKYAFERAGDPAEDPLMSVLEEIRARLADGA